jgi:hypothetical protein
MEKISTIDQDIVAQVAGDETLLLTMIGAAAEGIVGFDEAAG